MSRMTDASVPSTQAEHSRLASSQRAGFPRPHGPWTILSTRELYRDPWIDVTRDEVRRPDGKPGWHSVVSIRAGISILPVDGHGDCYLTEEFHYAVGRVTYEVVSGGRDDGEPAEAAAQRELQEELGLSARSLIDLGSLDPFTSMVVSPTQLFLAQNLEQGAPRPEGTEQIRAVRLPLTQALEWALSGTISHAPSAVLILKACLHLGLLSRQDAAPRA